MCRKRQCPDCNKASWVGCGLHIDSALAGVALTDRCSAWRSGEDCGVEPAPKKKPVQLQRIINSKTVINHVVLLKLSKTTSKSRLSLLTSSISSLASIPGVLSITCGPCFVPDSGDDRRSGFNYSLCVCLKDNAALNNYANDPEHVRVKREIIAPCLSSSAEVPKIIAVDWEKDTRGRDDNNDDAPKFPWIHVAVAAGFHQR
mmetsp:Transcript_30389/g.33713  ORF Transcript_30389/g.33713 Transcript_30389/m.33713 type:complete len:202 (-) Transcript_30389:49-654(-)|eukprot:CAMPEP_0194152288 /NCGR_PEP_ID=MMETSP0152-20130528/51713_1 /TAXON_ID=1049557 /ORGANISM="Thalassiothrix antarctica, Strain L6-D1" /LENGTH=201 /DNA_ID=CAMNT_0038856691 /DNA_START=30 /DNA_END=635 /DNA_ORIENTATION=-